MALIFFHPFLWLGFSYHFWRFFIFAQYLLTKRAEVEFDRKSCMGLSMPMPLSTRIPLENSTERPAGELRCIWYAKVDPSFGILWRSRLKELKTKPTQEALLFPRVAFWERLPQWVATIGQGKILTASCGPLVGHFFEANLSEENSTPQMISTFDPSKSSTRNSEASFRKNSSLLGGRRFFRVFWSAPRFDAKQKDDKQSYT